MTSLVGRSRAIIAVALAALTLALVPALPAQASGAGNVTATITENGANAAGVFVTLDGPEFRFAIADADGAVSFADLALGDYTLRVQASGAYQDTDIALILSEASSSWSGIVARQPWPTGSGSVAVEILNAADDAAVAGAHVTLSRIDAIGPSFEGFTDSDGRFTQSSLVAGRYVVGTDATSDHLGASVEVQVAEGASTETTIRVLAADAAITGRVVDPNAYGVAGIFVSAELLGGEYFGWLTGVTDENGYYSLDDASAGEWRVTVFADQNWEFTTLTVDVSAGSTATANDLVLSPRISGTIAGLVASSDGLPESTLGGFFDVCATALHIDGSPVPGAAVVTGGDSFYSFRLEPGEYTVFFEDCDPDREPHQYAPVYLGGSTSLSGAATVTVETLVDSWLDTTTLVPDLSIPAPEHDATPVRAHDLEPTDEDLIDAPAAVRRGETAEVVVGIEFAGQWVSAWIHRHTTQLGGWHQVSPEGTIEITVPPQHPVGLSKLVVQDADDEVIGWTDVRVLKRAG